MRANTIALAAQPRSAFGKKTGALRRTGWTPANIYGAGEPSVAVQVVTRDVDRLLTHTSRNALISLEVEGTEPVTVLVRGVARRPTSDELFHVDFLRINMTETLKSTVPIVLVGESPAVQLHEATILRALDALNVECLPADLPASIEVDISRLLEIGDAIHVSSITLPRGVTVLDDPTELVVHAVAPQRIVEEEEQEAAEEGEGAAEEEGEEAAAEVESEAAAEDEEKKET